MKTMKRALSIVLCVILAGVFSACSDAGGQGTGDRVSGGSNATDTVQSTAADETLPAEKDYSEKMTISLATVQIQDGKDYTNGDDLTRHFTEKFNLQWDITSLTWENWAERLRVWINSDDMPDMVVWDYKHGEAVTYAEQGLVKQLPEGWKDNYPHLAKAYGDTVMNTGVEEQLGGTFFLFRPVFSANRPADKLSHHMSAYLRQDWADAVGCELKDAMKWSEIIEYAKLVKEQDPGHVGANFYPIVIRSNNIYTVQSNSTYAGILGSPFYLGEDGQYQWGGASEDTLTGLKLYSQMYREGLLHPEFYTLQDPDDVSTFYVAGTSAVIFAEGMANPMQRMAKEMETNLGLDYDKAVRPVALLGEDGNYHGAAVTNFWCANAFSPNIEDAKLERLLDMIDYSCTDEGQRYIRMGLEGVDWEMGSDGEYKSLLPEGDILNDKYAIHPVYGNLMILSDDFQFINPSLESKYREKTKALYQTREKLSTEESLPSEPDWTIQFYSSTALNLATMTYTDEYASIVTKEGDIEENWKAWVAEKNNIINPVLDELNALN